MQPLTFTLFERSPYSPARTGLLLLLALLAWLMLPELLSGRAHQLYLGVPGAEVGCAWIVGDYRLAVVNALVLGYVTTARYVFAEHSTRNGQMLVEEFVDMDRYASRRLWGVLPGLIGVAITLGIGFDIAEREIEWTLDYWIAPHVFNWLTSVPLGWIGGRFLYAIMNNGVTISKLVYQQPVETIFNLSEMEPAYRQSSIGALLLTVFIGGSSVHFLDPGAGWVSALVLAVMFGIGIAFANIPLIGAVRSTAKARRQELQQVQLKIVEHQRQLLGGAPDEGRMDALLNLERRIQLNTGAFAQTYNLARLALYATLGLMSWLGAAAVEMVLDALLSASEVF